MLAGMETKVKKPKSSSATEVTLESKVSFLRCATSFPEPAYRVEAIETHLSWVFLTDRHAYKLKKAVRYPWLDFHEVDARRHYCEEELRLNQRLARGVYLGVVRLTLDAAGHLQLDGSGLVVDWLVKMNRLPTDRMLDYRLAHGAAGRDDAFRIAARLADFYRNCQPIEFEQAAYRGRFERQIRDVLDGLSRPNYRIPLKQINAISLAQLGALDRMSALFDERRRPPLGRIVEGHGDLRPEHICLAPELPIIDCLEFSRDLRIADTADELAFLMLECERLGAPDFSDLLLEAYGKLSGDRPSGALTHFYSSCRASLRALLTIRHLNEMTFRYSPEWRRRADQYLKLAEVHLSQC